MKRLMILQHGDYAEAYERFRAGGEETYRNQRFTVGFVASLAAEVAVTVVALGQQRYHVELDPGLRAMGIPYGDLRQGWAGAVFDTVRPDLLVTRTPRIDILNEARRRGIRVLPCFADIFAGGGPRTRLGNFRLGRALRRDNIPCVGNHGPNSARSIVAHLGIPRDRVVPWDWGRIKVAGPAKTGMADPARPTAFFAGIVAAEKGVGDCLMAIRALRARGRALSMSFAGPGDTDLWTAEAERIGVADAAHFLGVISSERVLEEMRRHDIVVVPTRHSYPEGMPKTINEGLASRSALVISDHPAFVGRLKEDAECLVFRAGDPGSLADRIARLCEDREMYRTLSENAEQALSGLYVGIRWDRLIRAFIDDPENRTGWVARNSLEALAV